jgi:hypothetical protein
VQELTASGLTSYHMHGQNEHMHDGVAVSGSSYRALEDYVVPCIPPAYVPYVPGESSSTGSAEPTACHRSADVGAPALAEAPAGAPMLAAS